MGAQENKQNAQAAYRAFIDGDAVGAMANMDDECVWEATGESAVSGTYRGKQEIAELWGQLAAQRFKTDPHDFVADGDKVIVLTAVTLDGETQENADVLTYNDSGDLVHFSAIGDPSAAERAFPR
jgi:ketosteroid isomerase-like protein